MDPILLSGHLVVFALGASLNDQFLADDHDWIRNARLRVEQGDWLDAFSTTTGGNFYRPLVALSFEADYSIWGYRTFGYHLHQTIMHVILVIAVAALLWIVTKNGPISFGAALLFAVYPSQHEVVTWLAGRPDLYAATFSVISVAAFLSFLQKRAWWKYALALVSAVLALLSKEIALILPALIIIGIPFVIPKDQWKRRPIPLVWALPFVVILGVVLLIRNTIIGDAIGGYVQAGDSAGLMFKFSDIDRVFSSMLYLVNWDFALARFGDSGLMYWGQWLFQALRGHLEIVIGSGVILSALLLHKNRYRRKLFLFGAIWAVICFIPVFGLSEFIAVNLTASRLFFLSSIGYSIIIASLILPYNDTRRVHFRIAIFTCVFLVFGSLWVFNYLPWKIASDKSAVIKSALVQQKTEILKNDPTDVYVGRITGLYQGAYVFFGVSCLRESLYEVTRDDSIRTFLLADLPYQNSGLCLPRDARTVRFMNWDEDVQKFTPGRVSIQNKLNDEKRPRARPLLWDFSVPDATASWEFHGVGHEQVEGGVRIEIPTNGERYLQSPKFEEVFLGDYTSATIYFDLLEAPVGKGQYSTTVSWAVRGSYISNSFKYTLDKAEQFNVRIPTCQYPNWSFSDHVDQLRFLPIQSGTVLLKSISVQ